MDLRCSERARKPRTVWEQIGAPSAASDPKIPERAARTVKKLVLKPVALWPLPVDLNLPDLPDLPDYTPTLTLQFQVSEALIRPSTELQAFQHFLTPEIVAIISGEER